MSGGAGPSLVTGAIPFAILAATIIFSAQSLLLITTLQAIGKTKSILGISLAATIVDLVVVGLGAATLGTTAGAVGRSLLAATMALLAWLSLRHVLRAPVTKGLSKAIVVSILSAAPLILFDNLLTFNSHQPPIIRIPALLGIFAICYLGASRALHVFTENDFNLFENALPGFLRPLLKALERVLIQPSGPI